MIPPIQMEKILELHNLAKESAAKFDKKRFIYEDLKKLLGTSLFIGIAGLRVWEKLYCSGSFQESFRIHFT